MARNIDEIAVFFLERDNYALPPGLRGSVIRLLNDFQGKIGFVLGDWRISGSTGSMPFSAENRLRYSRQFNAQGMLSIAVCAGPFEDDSHITMTNDGSYFISIAPIEHDSTVPMGLFVAFSVARALSYHYYPNLKGRGHVSECPIGVPADSSNIYDRMRRGSACEFCHKAYREAKARGFDAPGVLDTITSILSRTSEEMKKREQTSPNSGIAPDSGQQESSAQVSNRINLAWRAEEPRDNSTSSNIATLIESLGDGEAQIREQALGGLRYYEPNPDIINSLVEALKHPLPGVRAGAAKLLGEKKIVMAFDDLLEVLQDESPDVRRQAATSLGALELEDAVQALGIAALNDSDEQVRANACIAMGNIGSTRAEPFLAKAREDSSMSVRNAVVSVLNRIASNKNAEKANVLPTSGDQAGGRAINPEPSTGEASTIDSNADIHKTVGSAVAPAMSEYGTPEDALNYRVYANALGDLITHPKTETPLTICLAAPWGMGKTTLLNYIKDGINSIKLSGGVGNKTLPFLCIDFNAWKYSRAEQIWATFCVQIIRGLEQHLSWWKRIQLKWYLARLIRPKFFWVPAIAVIASLVLVIFFVCKPLYSEVKSWNFADVDKTQTFVSLGAFLVSLIGLLWNLIRPISSSVMGKFKKPMVPLPPSTQDEVFKYFENICKWLYPIKKGGKASNGDTDRRGPAKVIVFVDDLDRCSVAKILQVLDAVKVLLDSPHFVFVLSMDARIVRHAVGKHYAFMAETPDERERLGHDYLEKIIQIPFHLPQPRRTELISMKDMLLKDFISMPKSEEETESPQRSYRREHESGQDVSHMDEPDHKTQEPRGVKPPTEGPDISRKVVTQDKKLDMKLNPMEDKAITAVIKDASKISPRLVKRILNVYLLARHLYLESNQTDQYPSEVFVKWVALSILFPFEMRKVISVLKAVQQPKKWDDLFKSNNTVSESNPDNGMSDDSRMIELRRLLEKHVPNPADIPPFLPITNCFNLALD